MADSLPKILGSLPSLSFLILAIIFLSSQFSFSNSQFKQLELSHITNKRSATQPSTDSSSGCNGVHKFNGYKEKCAYLKYESRCEPDGYINYLHLFYCVFGELPSLGYTFLVLWLFILFYLLGNTAAHYFCTNLEALSTILKLSPTIAGVTLLSLGNGAPDAFSTIVSFIGDGTNSVGLNSVLGGAFFVSSVVLGTISIAIGSREISIERSSFIRDVCFLIFVLLAVLVVLLIGKINIFGAMAFASLYLIYVFLVSITHHFNKKDVEMGLPDPNPKGSIHENSEIDDELGAPLLLKSNRKKHLKSCVSKLLHIIELPLYLPRRLTIPDICEERWSKPYAVISVTLAPILLATLWISKAEKSMVSKESLLIILSSGSLGSVLGITTFMKTKRNSPPSSFHLPWLVGGFLMSVIWSYIIAEELVSLLVSFGVILQISASILGLTILAWGNSLGDLIANVAVALNGGSSGAQVAVSGCYGGPVFNLLVGLGLSLVLASGTKYPDPVVITNDPTLYQILGFMIGGLLWALVMVQRREMRIERSLGFGLISIYLCFLTIRLAQSLGLN
ncbi:hypothetical protein LUZ60_005564 [Juncus effusus]|nr:hypothetical protein LUZ60_005564 [Juncus effusus]